MYKVLNNKVMEHKFIIILLKIIKIINKDYLEVFILMILLNHKIYTIQIY